VTNTITGEVTFSQVSGTNVKDGAVVVPTDTHAAATAATATAATAATATTTTSTAASTATTDANSSQPTPPKIALEPVKAPKTTSKSEPAIPKSAKDPEDGADPKKKKTKEKINRVSFFTLYRFTSWKERLMLLLGAIGGLGHGVIRPVFILTFGNLINSLSDASTSPNPGAIFSTFNGFILNIVYLGIASFVGGYLRNAMFVHVGYVQADKIRKEYLISIFRQEMGWIDTKKSGELTTRLSRYRFFSLNRTTKTRSRTRTSIILVTSLLSAML